MQLSPIKYPGSIVFFSFLELQKDEEDKLSFRTGIFSMVFTWLKIFYAGRAIPS